jgi:2-oxoacid:acceptor oxidoreductase delta subunit (pyruvate/2-ketoisovalerate family)
MAINALERFVADHAKTISKSPPPKITPTGKSVGIVGSGPAGLTCAYHLALRGHAVTIFEAESELGGLLRYGIPSYRLPKDVLNEEVEDILALGIEARVDSRVEELEEVRGNHDAVFVATGFGIGGSIGIPGEDGEGVMEALEFLRRVNSGALSDIQGKVLVIGGGNAAIDAARSALRLGGAPTIVYRRSRAEMPAYEPEVEEAQKEGVTIRFLTQPVQIIREDGRLALVECVRNKRADLDDSGRRKAVPIEGSNFPMEADAVIVAVGERPDDTLFDTGLLSRSLPEEHAEEANMLSDGVYAGGDLMSPQRTVAHAIGSGRRTAMQIDRYLGGSGKDPADYITGATVKFDELNLDYFEPKPRVRIPMLSLQERERNFEEICHGLDIDAAVNEAKRCFHCGVCISCDNCFIFCPDIAVKKDENGVYAIDYDYCKGCGICVHECPRHAMSINEEIRK